MTGISKVEDGPSFLHVEVEVSRFQRVALACCPGRWAARLFQSCMASDFRQGGLFELSSEQGFDTLIFSEGWRLTDASLYVFERFVGLEIEVRGRAIELTQQSIVPIIDS